MGGVALQQSGDTGLPASSGGAVLWAAVEHSLVQGTFLLHCFKAENSLTIKMCVSLGVKALILVALDC